LNTLEDTTMDRLHNFTDNRSRVIASLELLIKESQIFSSLWAAGRQGWVHLIDTQQVQKIIIYRYNIKDKTIIRLNAKKHLHLTLKLWGSYLLSENWRLNYPISQLSKICPRRVIFNRRYSPTEDKCCCPTEDKDYYKVSHSHQTNHI
jgi:hypothetical protein